jgi:hypothetical protein
MKRRVNIRKGLLQSAALVFLLNTAAAYGACCFIAPNTDQSTDQAIAELPPCHQAPGSETDDKQHDSCLMCLAVVPSADLSAPTTHAVPAITAPSVPRLSSGGVDPPFRPPISTLA